MPGPLGHRVENSCEPGIGQGLQGDPQANIKDDEVQQQHVLFVTTASDGSLH